MLFNVNDKLQLAKDNLFFGSVEDKFVWTGGFCVSDYKHLNN